MPTEQQRTAYHEAGHAVLGMCLGFPAESATIVADESENTLGHVRHRPAPAWFEGVDATGLPTRAAVTWAYDKIAVLFAGSLAEEMFDPARPQAEFEAGRSLDYSVIADVLALLAEEDAERDALVGFLVARTKNLLRHAWAAVEAVANELLARGTLAGDEVREIMFASAVPPADCDEDDEPGEVMAADPRLVANQVIRRGPEFVEVVAKTLADWQAATGRQLQQDRRREGAA